MDDGYRVDVTTVVAAVLFLAGIALVVWSVEHFVEAVARSAVSLGVSGFFLAVVLAGVDLENAILGITAAYGDLSSLALGTVFGEAVFVLAVAVGVAGVLMPFETRVPRSYLLITLCVPIPMAALSLAGTLTWIDGVLLTLSFFPLLLLVYALERRASTRYMVAEEVEEVIGLEEEAAEGSTSSDGEDSRGSWYHLGVAIAATVGMTVGSALAVRGAEGVLTAFGLSGLAFGATVMSFIASLEELFLTVEPVRQGRPEIAVGNVVGSTLFYVTANVGLIALIGPVDMGGAVLTVQWPFFALALVLVVAMFYRGRVGRLEGAALLALYVGYWIANYL
ncbi:sodium:calcium antiporter [Halalkalicoccus salilacus]|uniref:sodium:calcium antiporter n=1 Tax=Halalkalicoccus salilacus TaxID=3117459 RepID=UPI0038D3AFF0